MLNIQHDIVSLLYSIKGRIETHLYKFDGVDAAQSKEALPEAHEALRKVYNQAQKALEATRRAAEIIRSKPDSNCAKTAVCLQTVWAKALTLLRDKYSTRQIDLIEHIPTDFPLLACRSEDMIEMFCCLIENALQAMSGKGCLIIRATLARNSQQQTQAAIVVADTGEGISADLLSNLFRPYVTTKRPGQGNGLGLCLVHGLARRNAGQVTIASFEGFGTAVTLTFPIVCLEE